MLATLREKIRASGRFRMENPETSNPPVVSNDDLPVLSEENIDQLLAESLRRCAWEVGENNPEQLYTPPANHAGLMIVSPRCGFAHWRITQNWIDKVSQERGGAWKNCRLLLKLYDVSYIEFNGFNAHRIITIPIGGISGRQFFDLPKPGSSQLA